MELGYKEQYNNDESFSQKCRCLSALAFLPSVDVIDGFEQLVDNDELPQVLVSYFEVNYIGCLRGRGQFTRRLAPIFSSDMWNVNLLVSNNLPRTNNNIEACHNAFKSSLSCLHPNIWKFIETLKKEEVWH